MQVELSKLFSFDPYFSWVERDCKVIDPALFELQLGRDVVLTTPWECKGFSSALAIIGSGKRLGGWRQDPNHKVTLVLPWGFGIVTNGNHSISAGILAAEGTIEPSEAFDLSPLLDRLACDGVH